MFLKWILLSTLVGSLVGCSQPDTSSHESFVTPSTAKCVEAAIRDQFLVNWKDGSVTLESAPSRDEFIENFLKPNSGNIDFAEHDYEIGLDPIVAPIESLNIDPEDWGYKDTRAHEIWAQGYDGHGVIIAVIDTGADLSHPQLQNQVFINTQEIPDGVDNDKNGYADDIAGWNFVNNNPYMRGDTSHGTHVSGIALADHRVSGMKGMAPKATLLPLKFIDGTLGSLSGAIAAIDYAVMIASREARPLVINASWGASGCSATLLSKIQNLSSKQVLFISAAGNAGLDLSASSVYPAAFNLESQISVGAHTGRNVLTTFSNFGIKVDLSAPGSSIFSLLPEGTYGRADGTSMATPFVTGAAAQLWSQFPKASAAMIKKAIFEGTEPGPFDVRLRGKLNVLEAKDILENL